MNKSCLIWVEEKVIKIFFKYVRFYFIFVWLVCIENVKYFLVGYIVNFMSEKDFIR